MTLPIRKDDLLSTPLQRTTYRDPEQQGDPVRTNETAVSVPENALDMDAYYRPLTAIHGAALHGPGVASGMGVQATIGSPGVTVLPGVALDSGGRHICLISGGVAEIGPKADVPGTPQNLVPVKDPVNAPPGGVTLPTTGLSPGPNYLTVEFGERFDEGGTATGAYRYDHTPWLRLLPTAGYDVNDRSRIILASVTLGTGPNVGIVTGLTEEARQLTNSSSGVVQLIGSQITTSGSQKSVADIPVGVIRARDAGGLLIATNSVGVQADGGPEKITLDAASGQATIASINVASDATIGGKVTGGTAIITGDATIGGKVTAGTAGITGDATVGGKLTATGPATVNGDLTLAGQLKANDAFFNGSVGVEHDVNSGGNLYGFVVGAEKLQAIKAAGPGGFGPPNLEVIGDSSFKGHIDITGDSLLVGNMDVSGVVSIGPSNTARQGPYLNVTIEDTSRIYYDYVAKFTGIVEILGQLNTTGSVWTGGSITGAGTITGGSKSFKIDHPLDPANKYLLHSAIESPDMMNIYNGNITTDDQGQGVVVLPSYFEALNGDYRYQLTVIGQPTLAYVSREIEEGQFSIKTERPNVKVSWQVTGVRHDPYALANRIRVEQDKPEDERGLYLHPEIYGHSIDRSLLGAHQATLRAARRSSPSSAEKGPEA